MKISLAWIFDYFEESFQGADVKKIVDQFNRKTAEIEHYETYKQSFINYFIVNIEEINKGSIDVFCKELDQKFSLPINSKVQLNKFYLVKKNNELFSWATLSDLGSDKDSCLTALNIAESDFSGGWRSHLETDDYVLDIDNKSINHRPDLWGHYGIAREIAATMGYTLKRFSDGCADQAIVHADKKFEKNIKNSFSIDIQEPSKAFRFAGLYCEKVQHQDSNLKIALRLIRLGLRPIDALVDLTNYVMFDIGHPMHVFDAQAFEKNEVVVRLAKNKEKLTLLDGVEIELRNQDLVIANHEKPLSLAGIYGGLSSGYTNQTESIFIEAAGFDSTIIRKTAQHFKIRTEASTRFEKYLDPMQNTVALQRFLFLAQELGVLGQIDEPIISVGELINPRIIELSHDLIEKKLGASIDSAFVVKTLTALGFEVEDQNNRYKVLVPTTRMTKDIAITEDIIEEIGRLYGFDNIPHDFPIRKMAPFSLSVVQNVRKIKQFCASTLHMHEVRDYLFYDESFMRELEPWQYDQNKVIAVQNPVSENWKVMVSSLIPHLLKHVINHQREHNVIRFFEWNNVWSKKEQELLETVNLSGVFYDAQEIDFYQAQSELNNLFRMLRIDILWKKQDLMPAWFDKHRSAALFCGDKKIGNAGMLDRLFCTSLSDQNLFIFELDATFLSRFEKKVVQYQPWSKYQDVEQDISLFVPLSLTVQVVLETIQAAHSFIKKPHLIDFYEQEKWLDKRSITIRYTISNPDKTLDKSEIESVVSEVIKAVQSKQAIVR